MKQLWALLLALSVAPAHGAGQDDDFLAARDAYNAGDGARLEAHAKALEGHLLEPYIAYWRLSLRLEEAAPEEVRAFLGAHRDSPVSDRLRGEWLKVLGRRGDWDLFDSALPQLVGTDVEIACYALHHRLQLKPAQAPLEARAIWLLPRDLPDSCPPLMAALYASGGLSTDDLWTRIRISLEGGQVSRARRVAEWLPSGQAPEPGVLESIASNPTAYLERKSPNLKTRAGREALMFAVHRLARTAPAQAARHWTRLEERFSEEEREYVWGMIAYLGAMRHERDALFWYARAGNLSDLQLAWKVRAALRAQDWPQVLAAVEAMTWMESSLTAWRYWKARALKALGRDGEADQLLKPLAAGFGFYGQLAQEELDGRTMVPAAAYKPSAEDVRAMSQHAGLRRALELYRLGQRNEATWEWMWAIRGFEDRQLLAAAEVAHRHHIYDRAIGTADRTVVLHDFELRYPAPYRDILKPHAAQLALDEAWVYGVIRQESRFVPDARSSAGASGLMQLMPGTARWVAQKLRLKNWRWSQVTQVDTNVSLGTYYLRHMLDMQDGQVVAASAAYNAGPTRARAWRPEAALEGAVFAETIPLTETRLYVKNVMANTTYYGHTLHQHMQSLRQRLGMVGPRLPDIDAAPADMN